MSSLIPVNRPRIYTEDKEFLKKYTDENWISSESPAISEFEVALATRFDRKHAIAVSSGTAALEIAFKTLDLNPGDEVIMPSFTIISCAQAVTKLGGIPVFVDSNIDDYNMDVDQIENKITSRTKAILAVHIYGLPSRLDLIQEISRKHNLFLIEDAAEVIGANLVGKPCGSFGDLSIMSFYANKHISTGEGGAILTNSSELAEKSMYFRNLCFIKERRFYHLDIGWNYRMTGLQAAVGLGQILNLNLTLNRKNNIASIYDERLSGINEIVTPIKSKPFGKNCYWVYAILLKPGLGVNANFIISNLRKKGVESRPFFYPLHKQPALISFLKEDQDSCPNAEYLGEYGFYLPSGIGNTDSEIMISAETLKEVLSEI